MKTIHAEAVKIGARPSRLGLMHDARRVVNCEECDACYRLHYDKDAKRSFTHWSLLAQEIVTARHPDHANIVILQGLQVFSAKEQPD